jgi:hypothetical protein
MRTVQLVKVFAVMAVYVAVISTSSDSEGQVSRKTEAKGDAFRTTCRLILSAANSANWTEFKKFCGPHLLIVQYQRTYAIDYDNWPKVRRNAFPASLVPDRYLDERSESDDIQLYSAIFVDVETRKPQSKMLRAVWKNYCEFVNHSFYSWINIGKDTQSYELNVFHGPAIAAKALSNVGWRIELREQSGKFVVDKLILTTH